MDHGGRATEGSNDSEMSGGVKIGTEGRLEVLISLLVRRVAGGFQIGNAGHTSRCVLTSDGVRHVM